MSTIVAPATPAGQGGIGIVRVSGPQSLDLLRRVFQPLSPRFAGFRPWTLHRGRVLDPEGSVLDNALAVFMPGPRTFTGEDVAELHCHGSPALLGLVLESLLAAGGRLAERGEFSRRAVLNGRMDLAQAEAVAELIAAPGQEAARWAVARLEGHLGECIGRLRAQVDRLRSHLCLAVDFPDDEVDARLTATAFEQASRELLDALDRLIAAFERTRQWREGITVALAGPVNAGKSSLLNTLLGRERALVSDIPGTTRDYLEETLNLDGLPVRLVDTAGLRDLPDASLLEARGMEMGRRMTRQADVVLLLIDGLCPDKELTAGTLSELGPERTVLVWNKADCAPPAPWMGEMPFSLAAATVAIAAKGGKNIQELARAVRRVAQSGAPAEPEADMLVPNLRQTEALRRARARLEELRADVAARLPWDLCSVGLEDVAAALEEVTGQATPDEVLNSIFATFCIGK